MWISSSNVVHFILYEDGGSQVEITVNGELVEDNWNHIAAAYDGSKMILIVNGKLLGQKDFDGVVSTSESSLYIGADPTEGSGLYLPCKIDELRIWNHARSVDHIATWMYDTLSTVYYQSSDSGLVAYYRFDQLEDLGVNNDGPDDIRDLSVNENHGDTHGNPILVDSEAMTGTSKDNQTVFQEFRLEQNYPNPFNPKTVISWQLAVGGDVELSVYDVLGSQVMKLEFGYMTPGNHSYRFDARGLSSGIYYYRIQTDLHQAVHKMVLVK